MLRVKKIKSSKKIVLKITMSMTVPDSLRGLVNIGDGYLLDLMTHLYGEEGDLLPGELDQEESNGKEEEL